jgi:hypothetical protein
VTTLTKVVLGMMGRLRPAPPVGNADQRIQLPPADRHGGMPLLDAITRRRSSREFAPDLLPLPVLSGLLWAAWGLNRPDGGRTAPSALNCQEVDLYVALPTGAYRYDAGAHALHLVSGSDVRRVTGYQDFVDDAPLDLVLVADHARMTLVPAGERQSYAAVATRPPTVWRPCCAPGSIARRSPTRSVSRTINTSCCHRRSVIRAPDAGSAFSLVSIV